METSLPSPMTDCQGPTVNLLEGKPHVCWIAFMPKRIYAIMIPWIGQFRAPNDSMTAKIHGPMGP